MLEVPTSAITGEALVHIKNPHSSSVYGQLYTGMELTMGHYAVFVSDMHTTFVLWG